MSLFLIIAQLRTKKTEPERRKERATEQGEDWDERKLEKMERMIEKVRGCKN
jgi:hypothetical protein